MGAMMEVWLESGTSRMRAKVPYDRQVKPGCSLRLKDSEEPDRWWVVQWASAAFDSDALKRGWNNNI